MDAIVQTINAAGRTFVDFALPMLVQSGLLIVILLAADAVLRRRVRAVFRYWIWMLVLVKLVLPPSLGSPVSVGTWFGDELKAPTAALSQWTEPQPAVPAAEPRSVAADVLSPGPSASSPEDRDVPRAGVQGGEVRGAADMEPMPSVTEPPSIQTPGVSLRWQGLVLLSWAAVATVLLLLLLQRAFFVRGLVAQADAADAAMQDALDRCRARIGLRREVGLRLSAVAGTPAACGLIRPVILIPQALAPRLEAHDLEAVLLHELAHIKRGDLWVNLAQTLLQIVHFYNPLLWLANAIIRRTREQAVDEAVLVAMGDAAQQYPETLVYIAKLAFRRRPALSLRLLGVVESQSALSAWIRHILTRPLPKTARLGVLGLLIIIIIGVIVLPMAKARPLTERADGIMVLAAEEARALNHSYVGTEHILLALASDSNAVSAKVLRGLGLDSERLKAEVLKRVQPGSGPVSGGNLPVMPRAKRVLEYAEQEARSLGHDYIGTEHILLALMHQQDGVAAQVLEGAGVSLPQMRAEVLQFVQPGHGVDARAGGSASVEPGKAASALEIRAAPMPDELTLEVVEECTKALDEGHTSTAGYLWVPVRPGTKPPLDSVVRTHAGKTWLLVHNKEPFIMVPAQGWRLAHVGRSTDENGRPMVTLEFDEAGAERLSQLTQVLIQTQHDHPLAILVDGLVVSAPVLIGGPLRAAVIVGDFTEQDIQDMIAVLSANMKAQGLAAAESAGRATDVLKRRMDEALPGATVIVPKGTYTTPVEITKAVVLRGESQEGSVIEVTADQPAILVKNVGKGNVTIENLTIRWQLATDKKVELPAAVLVRDEEALIRNCRFVPLGDPNRSPMAVCIDGRSKSTVENCRFNGFDYAICYGQGAEGVVQDCIITDCGHQGVINYDGSTLTVQRNIITGSKFHAVRCTGGTLHVKDNLLIKNANRGVYLGNKTGRGTITNNLIVGNGTGISAFGRADYVIANNVIVDNEYAGIDMRDSCRLSIRDNVLAKSQRGIVLHKEGSENFNVIGKNAYWANATDVESMDKPEDSVTADPQFVDPNRGDFSVRGPAQEQGHGLTDPSVIRGLWEKYRQLPARDRIEPAMSGETPAAKP
jgi:beta-lactamase regulating signal transducer with metallopeptidase domain/nitrous oxidase accessory protein NosD